MPTCCVWTADFMTFYVHEVYFMQRLILNVLGLGLCDIFMHLQFVFHIRHRCSLDDIFVKVLYSKLFLSMLLLCCCLTVSLFLSILLVFSMINIMLYWPTVCSCVLFQNHINNTLLFRHLMCNMVLYSM